MTILYGIPNCDTVKKARAWLSARGVDYEFADFKKSPPTPELVQRWLVERPLEVLLNKRGTTWRKLSPQEQQQADTADGAVALMCSLPSIIKRPVLLHQNRVYVGFQPTVYETIFPSE